MSLPPDILQHEVWKQGLDMGVSVHMYVHEYACAHSVINPRAPTSLMKLAMSDGLVGSARCGCGM